MRERERERIKIGAVFYIRYKAFVDLGRKKSIYTKSLKKKFTPG